MSDRRCDALAFVIADILDAERRRQGLSYKTLAERARISHGTVKSALDGQTTRTRTVVILAQALRLEVVVSVKRASSAPE